MKPNLSGNFLGNNEIYSYHKQDPACMFAESYTNQYVKQSNNIPWTKLQDNTNNEDFFHEKNL